LFFICQETLAYRYAVEEACHNFEASLQLLVSKLTTRSERRRSKKKKTVIKSATKAHRNASTGQKHQAPVSEAEHCECTDEPVVWRLTNPSLVKEDVVINDSNFFKEDGTASEDEDLDEDFECADEQVQETQTTVSLVHEVVVINGSTTQAGGDIASDDERLQRRKKRAEQRASLMSDGEQVSVSPGVYTESAQDARTAHGTTEDDRTAQGTNEDNRTAQGITKDGGQEGMVDEIVEAEASKEDAGTPTKLQGIVQLGSIESMVSYMKSKAMWAQDNNDNGNSIVGTSQTINSAQTPGTSSNGFDNDFDIGQSPAISEGSARS
jgi:hypothetical protein